MGRKAKNIDHKGRSKWSNEQYTKLTHAMLQNPNFLALSGSAVKVLMYMLPKHNGFNNGKIGLSYDDMAVPLHMGKSTVYRACQDLEYYGFIKLKKNGHFYGRKACEWEITFLQSDGQQANHDWKVAKKRLRERTKKPKNESPIDEIVDSPEYRDARQRRIEARSLVET